MARHMRFGSDDYSVEVTEEDDGHIRLAITFRKPQPRPAPPVERPAGGGRRVTVEANDHMRRNGVQEDEAVVLPQGNGHYEVSSRTEPGSWHAVHVSEDGSEACTCTAHAYRRLCRHLRAVRTLEGRPADAPLSEKDMAGPDLVPSADDI